MDEASDLNIMPEHAESSTTAMLSRDDDPFSRALRLNGPLGIQELIVLNVHASQPVDDLSSTGTVTSAGNSSHKPSTNTKPTTAGRSYPVDSETGKGKGVATYASSLSATHGSGSETELETARHDVLVGIGDWASDGPSRAPRRSAKPCRRDHPTRRPKHKKPVVIIQQDGIGSAYDNEVPAQFSANVARRNKKSATYLRHRDRTVHDRLEFADERRLSDALVFRPYPPEPLTRTRLCALISLLSAIALTFALFTFAAHYTGKGRMGCTKGIIFVGTLLISCFTVLAMVVARRTLQEALLAGLLEFLVGFALVVEIHDFM